MSALAYPERGKLGGVAARLEHLHERLVELGANASTHASEQGKQADKRASKAEESMGREEGRRRGISATME